MNEDDIRDLIYDAIQDGCINENHEELKYAIHFSLIGPDPFTNRTEARFYIEDVRGWESVFFDMQMDVDIPGFYFDIQDVVHLLVQDYLALPHNKSCYIQNGRANGKTKVLYNRGDNLGKYSKYFDKKKGNSTMATTEGIKIETATERYMSESEAWYDSELKKIEVELAQTISNAQYEAQKKRCELEEKFRALRIEEQEAEKAQKRRAYFNGLVASGFTEDQALKILLEDL